MSSKKLPVVTIIKLLQHQLARPKNRLSTKIIPIVHVAAVLCVIFVLEGSHQRYINKAKIMWLLWLVLIGLLHGGPLRPGLPTQFLVIYPHVLRVSIGSQVCASLSFQCPPYPDVIKCPEMPEMGGPNVLHIVMHLFPELLFWSLGTLLVNLPFFRLHHDVPEHEVAVQERRIRAVIRDEPYYVQVDALAKNYHQYFALFRYELLLHDSDVTAALAGLKRDSTTKFVAEHVLYSMLGMNTLLMPFCISLVCVIICTLFDFGSGILSLLSIDASDAFYAPEEGLTMKVLRVLKDACYYLAIFYSLYRIVQRSTCGRPRR